MDFRLSRITEHNKNEETDHLYDPLRDTLRKSSVSKGKTLSKVISAHELHGSRVSRKIRELSPEEAQQMQRQIWIPADKKLKPTDHLTRVAGKEFYAVDVQERQGPTLTQEEFKRRYHGNQVQETVYEFTSSEGSKQQSPFTNNLAPRFTTMQQRNTYNQEATDQNRNTYVGFKQTQIFASRDSKYATGSQYGKIQSQRGSGVGRFSRGGRLEAVNGNRGENGSERFDEYDNKYSPKPDLNGEDRKEDPTQRRNSKYGRAKSTYKYNLFSSLDEAVNTKCGSFGKNEIIASKPMRPWG